MSSLTYPARVRPLETLDDLIKADDIILQTGKGSAPENVLEKAETGIIHEIYKKWAANGPELRYHSDKRGGFFGDVVNFTNFVYIGDYESLIWRIKADYTSRTGLMF